MRWGSLCGDVESGVYGCIGDVSKGCGEGRCVAMWTHGCIGVRGV